MSFNFKIGNFNSSTTKTTTTASSSNDDFRKKIFLLGGILVAILVIITIFTVIDFLFIKHVQTYSGIETIMKNSAINYFKNNQSKLPEDSSHDIEIEASTLIKEGYMKDFSNYTKKGVTCDGNVIVEKSDSGYLYTPFLSCGKDYATKKLATFLTESKNIVTTGYGLYNTNGEYVYRGEIVNNYLKLETTLWRIVKINNSGNVMLVLNSRSYETTSWDDRFNTISDSNTGTNNYATSRIKEYLANYYNDTKEDEQILSKADKEKLVKFNLCIGKRSDAEKSTDNSIECSELLANQSIGLLTASDYMQASIDPDCNNTLSYNCENYNYLVYKYNFWLLTGTTNDTYHIYQVSNNGNIKQTYAAGYGYVRPTIYLSSNILYSGGNGTLAKPYTVK